MYYCSEIHQQTRACLYVRIRSAVTFTGSIPKQIQCLDVPVTFELLQTNPRLSCVHWPSRVDLLFQCAKWYWLKSVGNRACCECYRLVEPGSIQESQASSQSRGK